MLQRCVKLSALALVAALVACGGGESSSGTAENSDGASRQGADFSEVIARVDGVEITQNYFDARYALLSPMEKQKYSGEDWKVRFLDVLVEETLLYRAADTQNFDQIADVAVKLDIARRNILVQAYKSKRFNEDIKPAEEELQNYYEDNKDYFRKLGMVFGYHIQTADKARIDEASAELSDGKKFGDVARKFSEDEQTAPNGGELGWFNPDGYVLGIGYQKDFTDMAFSLEEGGTSEPFQVDENWHIVHIGPKSETEYPPLEDVRERVERLVRPVLAKEAYVEHLKVLKSDLGVERFGEYQGEDIRTAEQLYRLGAESQNPHAKLNYYDTLVEQYPEHEFADDALFMSGFIASEQFNDVTTAAMNFRRLIREWPESPFAEQSEWMLKNLGSGRAGGPGHAPQSPDAAAARIDAKRG